MTVTGGMAQWEVTMALLTCQESNDFVCCGRYFNSVPLFRRQICISQRGKLHPEVLDSGINLTVHVTDHCKQMALGEQIWEVIQDGMEAGIFHCLEPSLSTLPFSLPEGKVPGFPSPQRRISTCRPNCSEGTENWLPRSVVIRGTVRN